jgi:hypothetical protein
MLTVCLLEFPEYYEKYQLSQYNWGGDYEEPVRQDILEDFVHHTGSTDSLKISIEVHVGILGWNSR